MQLLCNVTLRAINFEAHISNHGSNGRNTLRVIVFDRKAFHAGQVTIQCPTMCEGTCANDLENIMDEIMMAEDEGTDDVLARLKKRFRLVEE